MVSVSIITVARFQRRHNARRTTVEWLERSSMRFKLSILARISGNRRISTLPKAGRHRRRGNAAPFREAPAINGVSAGVHGTRNQNVCESLCHDRDGFIFPDALKVLKKRPTLFQKAATGQQPLRPGKYVQGASGGNWGNWLESAAESAPLRFYAIQPYHLGCFNSSSQSRRKL
jgi:hypothetical protein